MLNVFSHHKCATRWLEHYLRTVAQANSLVLFHTDYEDEPRACDAHIAFFGNAGYDVSVAGGLAGYHVIRNPLSIVLSAYHSHLRTHTDEGWPELTVQRRALQAVDRNDGMLLTLAFLERADIARRARGPLLAMRQWDYADDRFVTLRMEDVVARPSEKLSPIMRTRFGADIKLPDNDELAFSRFAGGRRVGEIDEAAHFRSGAPDEWREALPPSVKTYLRHRFADLLARFYPDALDD